MEDKILRTLGISFIVFLVFGSIFELTILGIAFFNADEIECNLLWCTFTTKKSESSFTSKTYSECYQNGKEVNCSNLPMVNNMIEEMLIDTNGGK